MDQKQIEIFLSYLYAMLAPLAAKYMDADTWLQVTALVSAAVLIIWRVYLNRKARRIASVASRPDVPEVVVADQQLAREVVKAKPSVEPFIKVATDFLGGLGARRA